MKGKILEKNIFKPYRSDEHLPPGWGVTGVYTFQSSLILHFIFTLNIFPNFLFSAKNLKNENSFW
jgi:hypothetical protein